MQYKNILHNEQSKNISAKRWNQKISVTVMQTQH